MALLTSTGCGHTPASLLIEFDPSTFLLTLHIIPPPLTCVNAKLKRGKINANVAKSTKMDEIGVERTSKSDHFSKKKP